MSFCTAAGLNASAATPYTVSVGITTRSPRPMAVLASRIPVRSSASTEVS